MKNHVEFLEKEAKKQRISKTKLAEAMGLSYRTYYNKVKCGELTYKEVFRGVKFLGFSLFVAPDGSVVEIGLG